MAGPNDGPFPVSLGGLNSAAPASLSYPDAVTATNVRWGRTGELMKRTGFTTYNSTAMITTLEAVLGIFQFNRRDTTTRYTIVGTATRILLAPTSGAWTVLASSLTGGDTDYFDAAVYNNELIVVNGVDAPRITDGTAAGTGTLSARAAQTRTASPLAQGRSCGMENLDGLLIDVGGQEVGQTYTGNTQAYDALQDAWKTIGRPVQNRRYGATFNAFGSLYVVGGQTASNVITARGERYDEGHDVWIGIADMPAAKGAMHGLSINNSGYVATGSTDVGLAASGGVTSNYQYDPATNTWTTRTVAGTARLSANIFNIANIGMTGGGLNTSSTVIDTTQTYDPFSDVWTTRTVMPAARQEGGGCTGGEDGTGYVLGGLTTDEVASIVRWTMYTDAWSTESIALPAEQGTNAAAKDSYFLYSHGGQNVSGTIVATMYRKNISPTAPIARYVETFKGYVLLARTSSSPSRVFYSLPGESRIWPEFNFFDITPDDGDWITGMFVYDGRFYVSKTDMIYQVAFTVLDPVEGDHEIVPLENVKGTVSNRSIVVTDRGVFYLAEDGFRVFDGARSILISDKIQPTLDGYADARNNDVVGVWVKSRDEIWWSMSSSGSTHNRIVVLNLRWSRWSIFTGINAESIANVEDANDIDQVLFGTGSATDGKLYTADSTEADDTSAISAEWQSGWIQPAHMGLSEATPKQLTIWAARAGDWTMTVRTRTNYGTANQTSDAMNLSTKNSYFNDTTDLRGRILLGSGSSGHALSINIINAGATQRFEIHRMILETHPSPSGGDYPVTTA